MMKPLATFETMRAENTKFLLRGLMQEALKLPEPEWLKEWRRPEAAYCRFFYLLTQAIRPRIVVELGTCQGVSAMCFAEGSPDTKVVTLDAEPTIRSPITARPNIEYRTGWSCWEADEVAKDCAPIDVLFCDTAHDGFTPMMEYEAWRPHMSLGGLMFFDDIGLSPQMRTFWATLNEQRGWHEGDEQIDLHDLHCGERVGFGGVLCAGDS